MIFSFSHVNCKVFMTSVFNVYSRKQTKAFVWLKKLNAFIFLQYHPTATDLSSLHRHCWKPTDLKRMEKILLDKLDWNLHPSVTSLSYIHIIYRMLSLISSQVDRHFLELLVQRSELFMNYTRCARYQVSRSVPHTQFICYFISGI
jgi:hypothetical protein